MEFLVDLNQVENVKEFVRLAQLYDCDILVKNQDKTFTVDAGSIMGVFSLDLSQPVVVSVRNIEAGESFRNDVWRYLVG